MLLVGAFAQDGGRAVVEDVGCGLDGCQATRGDRLATRGVMFGRTRVGLWGPGERRRTEDTGEETGGRERKRTERYEFKSQNQHWLKQTRQYSIPFSRLKIKDYRWA